MKESYRIKKMNILKLYGHLKHLKVGFLIAGSNYV